MKTYNMTDINNIKNLFWASSEGVLVFDNEKNIIFTNNAASRLLDNEADIKKIENYFSFDVCVLNDSDITGYNPLSAAFESVEPFRAEALYQVGIDKYKLLMLRSFSLEGFKVIILSDITAIKENKELKNLLEESEHKIIELENNNKEYFTLKERAESQAIRVGLINRISTSIRDSLNISEITRISINELSRTLGVQMGILASYDKEKNHFTAIQEYRQKKLDYSYEEIDFTENQTLIETMLETLEIQASDQLDEGNSESKPIRMLAPLAYHGDILGMIMLFSSKKSLHSEEISLVEGISAQVSAAIYQALIFEELENQKSELEQTLVQLKEAQSKLIQSEKMASLGKLVAGVAHEINTPIGALNSNVEVLVKFTKRLQEKLESSLKKDLALDMLDEINNINSEAIMRINSIVKSLKNFARLDEAELKSVDIHDGIRSTLMLINHETKNKVSIAEDYGTLDFVECYPNLLNQVIMNILINAVQSIENTGAITIKTEQDNDKARILISDTGRGISQENLERIFDPGFTTKGVGVGTGLGLSICYQIIEKHHGVIKATSEKGKGSTFIIEIPLTQNGNC